MSIRLGDVAEFVRGVTFKPDDVVADGTPGSIWCMRTKNVQSELDLSDTWSIDSLHVRRKEQYLRPGDVLVSSANSWNLVGKCCRVPHLTQEATFGGFISVLRAKPSAIDPRYLYRWFSSPKIQATVRSFGRQTTNISNIDFERCLKLRIPVPEILEQERIAEILDQADELRVKRRQVITLLNHLSQSIFLDMFGDPVANPQEWQRAPLTEICHAYSGGTPSKAVSENWIGDLPWFSAKDLKHNDLWDSQDHINDDIPKQTSLRLLAADTVVIVVRGMILRHTFPVSVLRVPATINQDLKAIIPRIELTSQFLAHCLRVQSIHILQQVSTAAHGTARLDTQGMSKIQILLPPRHLQDQFVARVADLERLLTAQRKSMNELNGLFASLQARAFRNEL